MQSNLTGQLLSGRYRVLHCIGEGAVGSVYEAEHVEIGKHLALKVLRPQYASNIEILKRFRREARAATTIGHPNIVDVTDFGVTEDGRAFSVMELLDGKDLADVLADTSGLTVERTIDIALQICSGLHAAHEAGIVHRDLKPENIFLIASNGHAETVKILDFGIALHLDLSDSESSRLTKPGVAMGTPEYMAPEQLTMRNLDRRVDVYATGTLLYEMLTGRLPFTGHSPIDVIERKAKTKPQPLTRFAPSLPAEINTIVLRAIAAHRDERFSTMKDLAEELSPYRLRDTTPQAIAPTRADRLTTLVDKGPPSQALADPRRRIRWGQWVVIAMGLASVIGIAAIGIFGGDRNEPTPGAIAVSPVKLDSRVTASSQQADRVAPTPTDPPAPAPKTTSPAVKAPTPTPPDAGIDARPPARMTLREVDRLLQWAERAAAGGRFVEPPGDNLQDLLAEIEADYPGHPGASRLHTQVCQQLLTGGKRAQRRRNLDRAIEQYGHHRALCPTRRQVSRRLVSAHLRLGRSYLKQRKFKAARRHVTSVLAISKDAPQALELSGDISTAQRQYRTAITAYRKALKGKTSTKARRRLRRKLKKTQRLSKRR